MFHHVLDNDLIVSEEACYDGIDDHVTIDFFLNKADPLLAKERGEVSNVVTALTKRSRQ